MPRWTPVTLVLLAAVASAEDGTAPNVDTSAAGLAPVMRTYAMRQTFTSQMREPNPFSNKEWRSTHTHTWAVVAWQQVGSAVTYTETVCGLVTEKVFGAETTYTDAFIRSVGVKRRTGILAGVGTGAVFRAGPYAQWFGVDLKDPMKDPLPTDPKDPRLVDTDKDGQPGVTVKINHPMVGAGDVYVAQRSVVRLEGTQREDGTIRGVIYTAPEMFKIDANRWWLKVDSPQRQHPDPAQRPFVLKPVADGTSCATVMAQKDTLFD